MSPTRDEDPRTRDDEARARHRAFFETPAAGIAVTSPTKGWLEVNDHLCSMLGYSREELFRTTWPELTHPDDLAADVTQFEQVLRGEIDRYAIDKRFFRKDGTVLWMLVSVSCVRRPDWTVDYFVSLCNDIGQRKEAEEALRQSEARFRRLFHEHSAVKLILDAETGQIRDANKAALDFYGWSLAELVQMRIDEINVAPPDDTRRALDAVREGKQTRLERRHRRADGSVRDIEAFPQLLEIEGRRHLYAIIYDVTERRLAEEEKERVEAQNRQLLKAESLARMAAAIAHHFNNQLQVVLAHLDLATEELPEGARAREDLRAATSAAGKAADLSRLMRTYLGQDLAERVPVDLSEACARGLETPGARMDAATSLTTALESPGPIVSANPRQLVQLVVLLVTNALEALREGPREIHVSVATVAGGALPEAGRFPVDFRPEGRAYASLEVADSGCGIPEQDVERIFDPFFSTKFLGRGLGLAVVLGIVRSLNGAVAVTPRAEGGTRFRVFLPAQVRAPAGADRPPTGASRK